MEKPWKVIEGNCLTILKTLPSKIIQTTVTSPPYYQNRYYGTNPQVWGGKPDCAHEWGEEKKTSKVSYGRFCRKCGAWEGELGWEPDPNQFVRHLTEIFHELRRVTRDDGTLWLNIGDTYSKKNYESLGLKEGDLMMIPFATAMSLRRDGWYLRNDNIWEKSNPASENVKDRCQRSHEYLFMFGNSRHYYYDLEGIREEVKLDNEGRMSAPKYGADRPVDGAREQNQKQYSVMKGANRHTIWRFPTQMSQKGGKRHIAPFPDALPRDCILAGTSSRSCPVCGAPWLRQMDEKGITVGWEPSCGCGSSREADVLTLNNNWLGKCIVFDPFSGSGTTGKVALHFGRAYIGTELNHEMAEESRHNIENDAPMFNYDFELADIAEQVGLFDRITPPLSIHAEEAGKNRSDGDSRHGKSSEDEGEPE